MPRPAGRRKAALARCSPVRTRGDGAPPDRIGSGGWEISECIMRNVLQMPCQDGSDEPRNWNFPDFQYVAFIGSAGTRPQARRSLRTPRGLIRNSLILQKASEGRMIGADRSVTLQKCHLIRRGGGAAGVFRCSKLFWSLKTAGIRRLRRFSQIKPGIRLKGSFTRRVSRCSVSEDLFCLSLSAFILILPASQMLFSG